MSDPYAAIAQPVKGDPYAHIAAPVGKKSGVAFDPVGDTVSAVQGAFGSLKDAVQQGYKHASERLDNAGKGKFSAPWDGIGDTANLVKSAAGAAVSPVAGVARGLVIHPAASALANIPTPNPTTYDQREASWEQGIGNALAAIPAGRAGGAANIVAKAAPAARTNALADTVAQFDRAQVRPSLVAVTGGDTAPITKAIASNPLAGIPARRNLAGALGDAQASAARIAGKYGTPGTRQAAGEAVQQGVKDFANGDAPQTFNSKAGGLYDDVFGKLDTAMAGKTEPRQIVPNRGTYYTQATKQIGGSQLSTAATQGVLKDVTGGAVQSKPVADIITDPQLKRIATAVQQGTPDMNFSDLRQLRTFVRTAQQTDGPLRQTVGKANLQRLEGALTQDIYTNAQNLGSPQLLHQLRRADQFYAAGMQRIGGKLNSIAKNGLPGESAYDVIQRAAQDQGGADLARVTAVKRSLGSDWGDVAATMASRLGKPLPGAVGTAGDDGFSVARFVTNYAKLSPAGRETVFGARGGGGSQATALKAELDNLAVVAARMKAVESASNHSNTATHLQTLATGAALAHPATTIPTALSLLGSGLTAEAMTSPAVVRTLARLTTAKASASSQAFAAETARATRLAKSNRLLLPLAMQAQAWLRSGAPTLSAMPAAQPQSQGTQPAR